MRILILIGFLFLCLNFNAALAKKRVSFFTAEDVALAYYKTGGFIPDFEQWIKQREPYSQTPVAMRPQIYAQERSRLRTAYRYFDPKEDLLLVRTFSHAYLSAEQSKEGDIIYRVKAEFVAGPDVVYFPYEFLGQRIILMPYSLDEMLDRKVSKQQYEHIDRLINPIDELKTIIRMRPVEADFSKPHKIDGLEQWVFKTRIASIEFFNDENELIWEYTAPWYLSSHTKDFMKLYKNRPVSSSTNKGIEKPVPDFSRE